MSRQSNRGYLLPEPLTGYELDCLTVKVPRNKTYQYAIIGAITTLTKWWQWERTGDNSGSIAAQYWRDIILDSLTIGPCEEPRPLPPAQGSSIGAGGSGDIETFLYLLEELDMKYRVNGELYEVVLDLVPCGCGGEFVDGDLQEKLGALVNNPELNPGAADVNSSYVSLLDLCAGIGDWLIPSLRQTLNGVENATLLSQFAGEFVDVIESLVSSVAESLDELEDAFDNQESALIDALRPAVVGTTPVLSRFNISDPGLPLSRDNLRGIALRVPPLFSGGSLGALVSLWANTTNLETVNGLAARVGGQGSGATDCESALTSVGRVPVARPPDPASEFSECGDYDFEVGTFGWNDSNRNLGGGNYVNPHVVGSGWRMVVNTQANRNGILVVSGATSTSAIASIDTYWNLGTTGTLTTPAVFWDTSTTGGGAIPSDAGSLINTVNNVEQWRHTPANPIPSGNFIFARREDNGAVNPNSDVFLERIVITCA